MDFASEWRWKEAKIWTNTGPCWRTEISWSMKLTTISVVVGTAFKNRHSITWRLEKNNWNHPDPSTTKIDQNTLKNPGDLSKPAFTLTSKRKRALKEKKGLVKMIICGRIETIQTSALQRLTWIIKRIRKLWEENSLWLKCWTAISE